MKSYSLASSSYAGKSYMQSIELIKSAKESFIDNSFAIKKNIIQLCPQHIGYLSPLLINNIKIKYKEIQFRLHANVKVWDKLYLFDASSDLRLEENKKYILKLKEINNLLGSKIYSYHAGRRCSIKRLLSNVNYLEDFLGCEVAVEGLYPTKENKWNLSSYNDHEDMFYKTNLKYVIDFSHFNIINSVEKRIDFHLLKEMIESPRCLEIHISDNDGEKDSHHKITKELWWFSMMSNASLTSSVNIFSEESRL